jgi:hypothetical protein
MAFVLQPGGEWGREPQGEYSCAQTKSCNFKRQVNIAIASQEIMIAAAQPK